jgi:hypothetical protein
LQQQVPRVWPGDPLDLGTRALRIGSVRPANRSSSSARSRSIRSCGGGSRRSQAASRVITSLTVVTTGAGAALAAMIGVVLLVAMRSCYWPVAGRHSLRGEALRERGNRPDRGAQQRGEEHLRSHGLDELPDALARYNAGR